MKKYLLSFFLGVSVFLRFADTVHAQASNSSSCPSDSIRSEVVRLWLEKKPALTSSITNAFTRTSPDPSVLYNIQSYTNNLLEMTVNCHDTATLDQLAGLYLTAHPYLTNTNGTLKWVNGAGVESVLSSTQFLYMIARTTDIIASLPLAERTQMMNEFVTKYIPVLINHYNRWIWNEKYAWLSPGWGCEDRNLYTHSEYLQKLYDKALGSRYSYCNVVIDTDMWIIAGAEELLSAHLKNPVLIDLGSGSTLKNNLFTYVTLGTKLIQSRVNTTNLKDFNNQSVNGLVFDKGAWSQHPDYKYAGYSSSNFPIPSVGPTIAPIPAPNVSWDVSHARRFVHVFTTMHRNRSLLNQTFPTDADMKMFANQLVYGMFNRDTTRPLFANYFDGSNGWYRVNYSGRIGFGYAPGDLSLSVPDGGYGFWAQFNPDLYPILERMYTIMTSTNPADIDFRKNHYGSYYNNYVSVPLSDFSYTFLAFLPSLVNPSTTPAPCSMKIKGDADCNSIIDTVDFQIFQKEYFAKCSQANIAGCTPDEDADGNLMDANFNYAGALSPYTDEVVNLKDFEIWRSGRFL